MQYFMHPVNHFLATINGFLVARNGFLVTRNPSLLTSDGAWAVTGQRNTVWNRIGMSYYYNSGSIRPSVGWQGPSSIAGHQRWISGDQKTISGHQKTISGGKTIVFLWTKSFRVAQASFLVARNPIGGGGVICPPLMVPFRGGEDLLTGAWGWPIAPVDM